MEKKQKPIPSEKTVDEMDGLKKAIDNIRSGIDLPPITGKDPKTQQDAELLKYVRMVRNGELSVKDYNKLLDDYKQRNNRR
jgi:hypothetical protein